MVFRRTNESRAVELKHSELHTISLDHHISDQKTVFSQIPINFQTAVCKNVLCCSVFIRPRAQTVIDIR